MIENCKICPRFCRVNRKKGELGFCGAGSEALVAHYGPHFGEEPPITGTNGSGNIFFSLCNLRCVYCQNYQISHDSCGGVVTVEELVTIFFSLEAMGCHNVNLVSPTPYIPFIAAAVSEAKGKGITIPFIYNTNAYENTEALRHLEGLIDIYLPDFKYWSVSAAERLSGVPKGAPYRENAQAAIIEMKRQVGDLLIEDGIAKKGILVRHLVLPGGVAGSREVFRWIDERLGEKTFVGLMSQYLPIHRSNEYPILNRRVRQDEYDGVVTYLVDRGFYNVFIQELGSAPVLVPDFSKDEPFGDEEPGTVAHKEERWN